MFSLSHVSLKSIVAPPKTNMANHRVTLTKFCLATLWLTIVHQLHPVQPAKPQTALPWMTQVAALSGQAPKLSHAPLIQLDTSSKYYKVVVDGMMHNFKRAVHRASEQSFSLNNVTTSKPINLVGKAGEQVSVHDLQIDGLNEPKVVTAYVNKKNMKLHVIFVYRSVRAFGKCSALAGGQTQQKQSTTLGITGKPLLEATNWNTSWSASVMKMIGREHFDMSRVYASHSQQKLNLNFSGCPPAMHDKLKSALIDRVRSSIEQRLVEIMETVMMQTDSLNEDFTGTQTAQVANKRGKRALEFGNGGARKGPAKLSKPKLVSQTGKSSSKPAANPLIAKKGPKVTNHNPRSQASRLASNKNETKNVMTTTIGRGNAAAAAAATAAAKTTSSTGKSQKPLKRTKRQTPCQQGEELDDYVDQLFRFGTRIVRAMEPITLPNATIELPDYNLKIFLYEGKGTRAYKFRRTKGAWVFCSNETISLGLTIEVEELRVAYKYRVISGTRLVFDGDLEAKLSPKVQAQFSQAVQEEDSEEPVQQRVDRIRVFRLGKVHVVIRGLGNLTQSLSMLINSYLNDNQEELQPTFRMVEGDAVKFINRMLANVNVPLLSVV